MDILTPGKTAGIILLLAIVIPLVIGLVVGTSIVDEKDTINPISPVIPPIPSPPETIEDELDNFLYGWERAWESKNTDYFMGFYHEDFNSRGMDYYQLRKYQRDIFSKFRNIELSLDNATYQDISDDRIRLKFHQKLILDDHSDSGTVTMEIVKCPRGLQIISETWKPY